MKKTKIYISGAISGENLEQAKKRFAASAEFWQNLGFEAVNPFNNGLDDSEPWIKHICKDIELLYSCDILYLLEDWEKSKGASIEYDFAVRLGKRVLFERSLSEHMEFLRKIQLIILERLGLNFQEYNTPKRKKRAHFARLIFAYHCNLQGLGIREIARQLNRSENSVLYLLEKYHDEKKYNTEFRAEAEMVERLMGGNSENKQ